MNRPTTQRKIYSTPSELIQTSAEQWCSLAKTIINQRDAFYVAMAGGNTPRALYETLSQPPFSQSIDWSKIHIYLGDERWVPSDHPDSNYNMLKTTLLNHVAIPEHQIHPMRIANTPIEQAADRYSKLLTSALPLVAGTPQFDLVLLGIGSDGHTASLFPGSTILDEHDRWVAEVYVNKLNCWRMSLTYPVLNAANHVWVLASGAGKADIIAQVLEHPNPGYPINRIQPLGELTWILDQAAASQLAKKMENKK